MESDKQYFRHILLFYYRKGKNAVQARKKLTDVYGEGVLTVRQCQNCFAEFRSGNFDVEDAPRSGRSVEADKDAIKALVDANRRITTQRNLCRRIDVCDSLFKRYENDPFLKRIITGDEKGHGAKKMNRLKPFPKSIFTKKGDAVCLLDLDSFDRCLRMSFIREPLSLFCDLYGLVVKFTDLWLKCPKFEPCAAEYSPCEADHCTLNLSRLKPYPVGVVSKERRRQLRYCARHLTLAQNYESRHQ
ncbi:HTH_48 domain-containing protein [Trichonephila clavipes]|nr:HTH_48 domain-containing protein [Trichonephila clavipes]